MRLLCISTFLISIACLSVPIHAGYDGSGGYVYKAKDREVEATLLKKYADIAKRKGNTLTLYLQSGRTIRFQDMEACNGHDDCERYVFGGLLPGDQFFIINLALWEGSRVYLVSRLAGTQYEVYAEPHVSPDGRCVVSVSASEAYNIDGVFLWEIKSGSLIRRFDLEKSHYALYRFLRWNGSTVVELMKFTHATKELCPTSNYMELQVRLIAENGAWRIDETPIKGKVDCK